MKQQIFLNKSSKVLLVALLLMSAASGVVAQTAVFTFQGKLSDGGSPANGNYDLQFKLYDALTGGAQIGVRTRTDVPVTSGNFTVQLDFAVGAFSGPDRFLETGVRPAGSPNPFTTLSPRQPITSSPYAFHSLSSDVADAATNANQLGGVVANQYVLTTDTRMTDARAPTAGSADYIQNTTSPQTTSNFNISGNGTAGGTLGANIINATTQYNIGGSRVLSVAGGNNVFGGVAAGAVNTGSSNSFFGALAGQSNTSATGNSFFGAFAGQNNTASNNAFFGLAAGGNNTNGGSNSFFGALAGNANSSGSTNAFFGAVAGQSNTTGSRNAFFGSSAGSGNATATDNSFFGSQAGQSNTAGFNSFFGSQAGLANTTGGANAFFGSGAGLSNTTGSSNSFFGRLAGTTNIDGFNNSFFGTLAGQNNTTGAQNTFVGYAAGLSNTTATGNSFFGDSAGRFNTDGIGNSFFGVDAGRLNTYGAQNSFFGFEAGKVSGGGPNNSFFGYQAGANSFNGDNSFFGSLAGLNNGIGSANSFFGARAGDGNISGAYNSFFGADAGNNTTGNSNTFMGLGAGGNNTIGSNNTAIGDGADVGPNNLTFATAIGSDAIVNTSNTIVLGRSDGSDFVRIPGLLTIPNLAAAGMTNLCRNSFDRVADCSSSLRYKTNLAPYLSGLSVINRLRPISFTWKDGGMRDLGFGAEDVEKIDPLLVTYNKQGQVEGVKYDRFSVVLINAIKEQQQQIAAQQKEIRDLKSIRAANTQIKAQLDNIAVRLLRVERRRAKRR